MPQEQKVTIRISSNLLKEHGGNWPSKTVKKELPEGSKDSQQTEEVTKQPPKSSAKADGGKVKKVKKIKTIKFKRNGHFSIKSFNGYVLTFNKWVPSKR